MALNLDHLAEKAGVSKATVSRVLNGSSQVTAQAKATVMKVVKETGYQLPPRRRKRQKVARTPKLRTGNILLLNVGDQPVVDLRSTGYPDLMRGVENETQTHGLKLVLASLYPDGPLPAALKTDAVDGVLLYGRNDQMSQAAMNRLKQLAVVALMRGFDSLNGPADRVLFDNAKVGPLALDYLVSRGHKHIGFYNVDPKHPAFVARLADFKARALQHQVAVTEFISPDTPTGLRAETAAFRLLINKWQKKHPQVTGFYVACDYQLPQLCTAMDGLGIEPSAKCDLIGCDNMALFLDQITPRPASIDINLELVGRRGVQQLLWRLTNQNVKNPIKVLVEPVLVEGHIPSSGDVRSAKK
ncbi:MAG TPA: hypothetical protein DCM28_10105 [Phycisphaerales bacterium]|nr:hypothetical protein [Phycisphaerales bacterium]HCD31727.1 hypothetical protein [Phycisphaerales bacterium]|tara:strand:+ start:26 stop:1096 length:1071 start_codon:yes stop_codon:yes gene_type:complete